MVLVGGRQTAIVVARYDSMIPRYLVRIMYQIRMYLVSAGRNLYVRTLCFCFCFPFLFQQGTPTFLVTKVLGICVRSFIRRENENPPEILYTKRDSPGDLLNSWIFNFQTRYTAKTRYTFTCLNIARPAADAHDQINCKKESCRLSSTCGAPRNHTNVPPVDAHV